MNTAEYASLTDRLAKDRDDTKATGNPVSAAAAVRGLMQEDEELEKRLEGVVELLLPLTETAVAKVLREVRDHPVKALVFFRWAGRQNGYEHCSVAYNVMARVLGREDLVREYWELIREMKAGHLDIETYVKIWTPTWFKKIMSPVKKSESGPVFRFFMDLNDSVSYVKRLNVPSGMVGACRLDVAYEHFKEKPHMFQFVPNEKQVKAANKLLKSIPQRSRRKKVAGVPVFSAQNLNIAVATNDGIRWYSPYFFDKNLLDNILEASMDQHFNSMIQNRHVQRRRDIVDDSLTSEILEESADSLFEPPEVQELMNEIGPAGIPLNVVTKAAEIQFLDVVDKLLLGNKWLRRATGIQPHFPYVVDSFEERTAVSVDRIATSSNSSTATEDAECCPINQQSQALEPNLDSGSHRKHNSRDHGQSHFPFSNLLPNIWPGHDRTFKHQENDSRSRRYDASINNDLQANPLLPKITMVGISMSEGGQMSKANLKKTMEDLTKELEQAGEKTVFNDEKDPLFVANVGDYSRITKIRST